jgi:hypothetical protein
MYDLVTKKYFYNQGTGTLTAGNKINFVDYIAFDGASWIDTGISYQDCTVECGLICPADSGRELMGWSSSASTYWGITNGQFELGGGFVLTKSDTTKYSEVKIEVAISDKRVLTLSHAGNSIKRQGGVGTGTYNYAIGAMPNSYSYGFIGNLYFHRFISPDGVLIQDLRPCVVAGEACFYDMVTGKVFTNAGTGTLKANGRFVESIVFDGASYIDTGIIGRSGISAEYNVYIPSSNIEKANVLLTGSRISSGDTRFYLGVVIHPYGKCWGLGIGTDYYQAKNIPTGDKYYYIQANTSSSGGELIVDGETVATTTATIDTGLNMYMGGVNNYGTPRLSGSEGLKFTYYKLYHDGTLLQDLRPYVDENGTACFKDVVTNTLFYNQGTGTLGYTEE